MPHDLDQHTCFGPLQDKAAQLQSSRIADMLADDPARATDFVVAAAGLRLDYSKQLIDREALGLLFELAHTAALPDSLQRQFAGERVNLTENRPALHTLLRAENAADLAEPFAQVQAARSHMQRLCLQINRGEWVGFTGKTITDVVNIGIGGSDLGPRLVHDALVPYHGAIRAHYVANVDPADVCHCLDTLNPETTLFIICSKSFRTEETLANGLAARDWMLQAGARTEDLEQHFLAVTTNLEAAADFGIATENCLPMWDWVGGRYSVWSAVGLSCAIALGWDTFTQFLAGARSMDEHVTSAAPEHNLAIVLSLLEVWCCNLLGANSHVVLPYDQSLNQLPNYLQQLTMESNGKQVNLNGELLPYNSAPVLWGSAGTIGQHSFHQLLHQGTRLCSADFVLPLKSHTQLDEQHQRLVANCLAQSRTMMVGRSQAEARSSLLERGVDEEKAERLAAHLAMPGNRPNTLITMDKLTPETLGALLALYEHRTFCSAQLWNINAFDQWGVELGKEIGVQIFARMNNEDGATMDASTEALIATWRAAQD